MFRGDRRATPPQRRSRRREPCPRTRRASSGQVFPRRRKPRPSSSPLISGLTLLAQRRSTKPLVAPCRAAGRRPLEILRQRLGHVLAVIDDAGLDVEIDAPRIVLEMLAHLVAGREGDELRGQGLDRLQVELLLL